MNVPASSGASGIEPPPAAPEEAVRRSRRRARGLTLWAICAVGLSPFAVPTMGAGLFLGVGLIVVALVLERRGLRARGPLVAGIVAVVSSLGFAGACGMLVLRTAAVSGREEARQDRVERRFDRAFDAATAAPARDPDEHRDAGDDGEANVGADFADGGVAGRGRQSR
jgi:hypothetical protein